MKKTALGLLIVLFIGILAGCGSTVEQDALISYLNEDIPSVMDIESKVTEGWEAVSGDNYTSDDAMYQALTDGIIPDSLDLVAAAEAVTVEDEGIKTAHELYISAVNKQHQAFNLIMSAIEQQDSAKISEANALLAEARKEVRDFLAQIEQLKTDRNVVTASEDE